jgi:predicted membrane-bound spermidine synthase
MIEEIWLVLKYLSAYFPLALLRPILFIQLKMAPLTHPSIVDGWFREINSQWPGQALTLKVNKILHMEKSQYQDVLVFESETYGNVLILDGVVQCTERDEFS